jgi:two-component system chemotaxis response regulator CheB
MPTSRPPLVVLAASAGGIEPLREIVGGLRPDLPAAVLVVLHIAPEAKSVLPDILARRTDLPVNHAVDGEELRAGTVYVAPPGCHMLVEDGRIALDAGPRENGHRPAADPLMRTVAAEAGPRACGVVLSGSRDDGTVGLAAIKEAGGMAIAQDPEDAQYPSMPLSAIDNVDLDAVLRAKEIAQAISSFASGGEAGDAPSPPPGAADVSSGELKEIVCPECGGVLRERSENGVAHFTCHVGHAFGIASLVEEQGAALERALWTAVRILEDRAMMLRRMADEAEQRGQHHTEARWRERAQRASDESKVLREAIVRFGEPVGTSSG